MKDFSPITIPNFTGMGSISNDGQNGAPYELMLVIKNPITGQLEEAQYSLRLSKVDAFVRWSLKWFGWPQGYVEPQKFVVQELCVTQDSIDAAKDTAAS
ncbi:MAG: hypothetical protein GY833_22100 [Aestuariibacter sp.]|nr:hypothetical protein [Aestuariibacter sp.]|tara:strand:- start:44205 stop:44501 length:297 start_codon:yes stop_codon:yes gene_type:complete